VFFLTFVPGDVVVWTVYKLRVTVVWQRWNIDYPKRVNEYGAGDGEEVGDWKKKER